MGTQKRLAVYLVRNPLDVPGIARLGPDAMRVSLADFAALLAQERAQLKGVLTTQSVIAGIGNAYSDEILHAAHLSPFAIAARLTEAQVSTLYTAMRSTLSDAVSRSVGQRAATLKSEKRSGLGGACPDRAAVPGVRRHRSARCRSRTSRCSTARPARQAARTSPTGDFPGLVK